MLFARVVETSERVAETSKRLEKVRLIAELLGQLQGDEVQTTVAYLSGATRQGRIGIGWATLEGSKAQAAADASLTIPDVDSAFDALKKVRGKGSEERKRELVHALMARATASEQRFLAGLLIGELRQGALEGIMLDAVAKASRIPAERVRRAAMMAGDLATVAREAIEHGEAGLQRFDVQLFRPVQPMLAQSAEDVEEALAELGEMAIEYKFDGARIQVHRSGDDVCVYTRSLNDVTHAVPEVVEAVRRMPRREVILDGEVLSLQPDGRPQPFQITMRRFGRKLDVEGMRAELPLTPYWFDLLYLDGQSLMDEAQARRFGALGGLSSDLVPHLVTASPAEAEAFASQAIAQGHEGVMAKATNAPYAAGARGQSWLKIKKARTLDLVILAAEWGHGRRSGKLSNLHLGARDVVNGGFQMLGKTFKGLTDQMLAWQTERLLQLEVSRDRYIVYVKPELVAEVAFNEIQVSPRYVSGLALRFARVKRYRTDKSAAEVDTFQTVQQMAGIA